MKRVISVLILLVCTSQVMGQQVDALPKATVSDSIIFYVKDLGETAGSRDRRTYFVDLETELHDSISTALIGLGSVIDIKALVSATLRNFIRASGTAGEVVINEDAQDINFRVEANSGGSANMFFVDAGNGRIGVRTNSPEFDIHALSTASGGPIIRLETSDAGATGPSFQTRHNSASPVIGDKVGFLTFAGNDDLGNVTSYTHHYGGIKVPTDGDESGLYLMQVQMDGTLRNFIEMDSYVGTTLNHGEIVFNGDQQNIDWRVESASGDTSIFFDASTGRLGMRTSVPQTDFHIMTTALASPVIRLETTDAGGSGPVIQYVHNSASPAAGDVIGINTFIGEDSGGDATAYVNNRAIVERPDAGEESGGWEVRPVMNGTLRSFIKSDAYIGAADSGEVVINDDQQNINFRIESNGGDNLFFADATDGRIGIGTNDPQENFHILTTALNAPVVRLETTNSGSGGPVVQLVMESETPSGGDLLGRHSYIGNDAALNATQYAVTKGILERSDDGGEHGGWEIDVMMNGTQRSAIYIDGYEGVVDSGSVIINDDLQNLTFHVKSSGGDSALIVHGDGSITVGNPTGGIKGFGTINAVSVYDDNSILSDYVFEPEYEMKSIGQMEDYYIRNKHLPTIDGREAWEKNGKPSLGELTNQLWETIEVQAIYIAELNRRLARLEEKIKQ